MKKLERRIVIIVNGFSVHLVLNKTMSEWIRNFKSNGNLWDFPIEEILDGTVEPNEGIWYWLINGRLYETDEVAE